MAGAGAAAGALVAAPGAYRRLRTLVQAVERPALPAAPEAPAHAPVFDAPRAAAFTASGPPPEADEETAELRLRIDETRDRIRRRAEGGELFGGEAPPPRDAPPQAG